GEGSAAELVSVYESTGFHIEGVTLRKGAGIHAAIYKTIGLQMTDVRIESPAGSGVLLSNAVDPVLKGVSIQVPGAGVVQKDSILGPTTGVKIEEAADGKVTFQVHLSTVAQPGTVRALTVRSGESVQKAVDALPVTGGDI